MIVLEIAHGALYDIHPRAYRGARSLEAAARQWASDQADVPIMDSLTEVVVTDGTEAQAWTRRELEEMRREEWRERCADMFNDH